MKIYGGIKQLIKDCKVQEIVSFLLRFQEAVRGCERVAPPRTCVDLEHNIATTVATYMSRA